MDEVEAAVREVNASAEVRRTCRSEVSTDWVLDSNSFSVSDLQRVQLALDRVSHTTAADAGHAPSDEHVCSSNCDHGHSQKGSVHSASTLSTHGLSFDGFMDLNRLKVTLDGLLYSFSTLAGESSGGHDQMTTPGGSATACAVYRMKGVFRVKDDNRLYILQAVHDIFDIQPSTFLVGSADDATMGGCNKVIVIGRNIESESIEQMLKSCVVP